MTRLTLYLCAASLMWAGDGTTPKAKAEDYPAHVAVGKYTMAAEYLVRSIPTPYGMFDSGNYLVIDVAFFGAKLEHLQIADEEFNLRVNGKKDLIPPESAGFVAAGIKYPDWETHPSASVSGGIGSGQVSLDTTVPRPRFPDDPTGRPAPSTRPPDPPDPSPTETPAATQEPHPPIDQLIQNVALPEGDRALPVSGLLFFAYKGKTKDVRSLELVYQGPAGKVTLKIE